MGAACCRHQEADHFPEDEHGERIKRAPTDSICLHWLIFCLILLVLILSHAFIYGDPRRLSHGFDHRGQLCGVDDAVYDKPFTYWCGMRERIGDFPKKIFYPSRTCLASCPQETDIQIPCMTKEVRNFSVLKGNVIKDYVNEETIQMVVTQSLTNETAYPTGTHSGLYCLPTGEAGRALRRKILHSEGSGFHPSFLTMGSISNAWPLFFGITILAVVLGYFYIYVLRVCAGMLVFTVCMLSGVIFLGMGVFFTIGIFFSNAEEDYTTSYVNLNPLFRSQYAWVAQVESFLLGMLLNVVALVLFADGYFSRQHIDDVVGIIEASCECLFSTRDLKLLPLIQSGCFMLLVILSMVIFSWVASVGEVDVGELVLNGDAVQGMSRLFHQEYYTHTAMIFTVLIIIWLIEIFLSIGRYCISYAAALFYFEPVAEEHQNMFEDVGPFSKSLPHFIIMRGLTSCLRYHLGTIALGAIVQFVTRPFRMAVNFVESVLDIIDRYQGDGVKAGKHRKDRMDRVNRLSHPVVHSCVLGIEALFGPYNMDAYLEVVLGGKGYYESAWASHKAVAQTSSDAVRFYFGLCKFYELMGIFFIADRKSVV